MVLVLGRRLVGKFFKCSWAAAGIELVSRNKIRFYGIVLFPVQRLVKNVVLRKFALAIKIITAPRSSTKETETMGLVVKEPVKCKK